MSYGKSNSERNTKSAPATLLQANYQLRPGKRNPQGVHVTEEGINFTIFSRHAVAVELLLFNHHDALQPAQVIRLNPEINRTFFVWHIFVEGLKPGCWYNWRMDGNSDTELSGLRFDRDKLLLDPWARTVHDRLWQRQSACLPGDNTAQSMRCLASDENTYDWQGDKPLLVASEDMIIYEMHVGGFTRHSSAHVSHPGTFDAVIEKIPYLQSLGISHIELLPIMAFDEQDVPPTTAELSLKNYWGYSTHSFYSPHPGYCIGTHAQNEFRDMVKALHAAGIGVILDVVFNHTAEGGEQGPTINFKGMGNNVFYHLESENKRRYRDYTGCGNTVNANHPIVANFIIECLEFWVNKMHVDGFRFDLASALARGEDGQPLANSPVLWGIELSERLAHTKLIAEAWDAAGLYQVGSFPGYRWAEWNGSYRDVLRRFIRGDKGLIGELATRICGSSDFYQAQQRLPTNSINFVTCHDGFTLLDLLSYEQKHNLANGEDNRDGCNNSLSCNHGVEGSSSDPDIISLRKQQARNLMAILLLSQGVPMILSGDEVLRSQRGNNNGYCQDNELTWFDWRLVEENSDMLRFVRLMIALRKRQPMLHRRRFLNGQARPGQRLADIDWHGKKLDTPPWDKPQAQYLAFTLNDPEKDHAVLHIMLNMSQKQTRMEIPDSTNGHWCLAVDTARKAGRDIIPLERQRAMKKPQYTVKGRSVVVLEFHPLS